MQSPLAAPYLLALLAGFAIMAVEFCGSRLITYQIGSSIYSWTAVIGVVLGGLSIGNMLGGAMAQKYPLRKTLGECCLMAGLLTMATFHLYWVVASIAFGLHAAGWGTRVFLGVFALLFLPSIALGTIGPMAAAWALRIASPATAGRALGNVYALGTWGAILGTFGSGFWLISAMGVASLLFTTAALLVIAGFLLLGVPRVKNGIFPSGGLATGLVAMAMLATWPLPGRAAALEAAKMNWANGGKIGAEKRSKGGPDAPPLVTYFDESAYFTIRVMEDIDTGKPRWSLILDDLNHGYIIPDAPASLVYGYEHIYAWITQRYALAKTLPDPAMAADLWSHVPPEGTAPHPPLKCLFLGGGAYTYPRYIEEQYPGSELVVSEIDPRVVEANHVAMKLDRATRIRTEVEDARRVVDAEPLGSYDLIYGDAFNGFSIPYHLTTREFTKKVKDRLTPNGAYLINVIDVYQPDRPHYSRFAGAFAKTCQEVFGADHVEVLVWEPPDGYKDNEVYRATFVLVCRNGPLDLRDLGDAPLDPPLGDARSKTIAKEITGKYLESLVGNAPVLTDDFAPVDQLLEGASRTRVIGE